MTGLLCYASNSGNTRATCEFVVRHLHAMPFAMRTMTPSAPPDLEAVSVLGLATWTYFLGVPPQVEAFIAALPPLDGVPVFVLSTYGMLPGQTLRRMADLLAAKGATPIAAYAFHTPESYPRFIAKGWDSSAAPAPEEVDELRDFVRQLDHQLAHLPAPPVKITLNLWARLLRPYSRTKARKQMGTWAIDRATCANCGTCVEVCPSGALTLAEEGPIFAAESCHACWACYNHCPQQAIYTSTLRGTGQYAQPSPEFLAKLI